MSLDWGRIARSSGGENGIGVSGAVTRTIGPSRSSKQRSPIRAATSAPTPHERVASCSTTTLLVLRTDARIASSSSGQNVRRSITSPDAPSRSAVAFRAGGPLERQRHHLPVWDHAEIRPLARDASLADRRLVAPLGHLALRA